jgi:hypothetical protein
VRPSIGTGTHCAVLLSSLLRRGKVTCAQCSTDHELAVPAAAAAPAAAESNSLERARSLEISKKTLKIVQLMAWHARQTALFANQSVLVADLQRKVGGLKCSIGGCKSPASRHCLTTCGDLCSEHESSLHAPAAGMAHHTCVKVEDAPAELQKKRDEEFTAKARLLRDGVEARKLATTEQCSAVQEKLTTVVEEHKGESGSDATPGKRDGQLLMRLNSVSMAFPSCCSCP